MIVSHVKSSNVLKDKVLILTPADVDVQIASSHALLDSASMPTLVNACQLVEISSVL